MILTIFTLILCGCSQLSLNRFDAAGTQFDNLAYNYEPTGEATFIKITPIMDAKGNVISYKQENLGNNINLTELIETAKMENYKLPIYEIDDNTFDNVEEPAAKEEE